MKRNLGMVLLVTIILQLVFIAGCGRKEVEDLAVGTMSGIDWGTKNGVDRFEMWGSIMSPKGKAQQVDKPAESTPAEIILKGEGITVQEAVNDLMKRLPRSPIFGHASVSIIGERLAKEKMVEWAETFARYQELRPKSLVFLTRSSVASILQLQPAAASTLSKQIVKKAEETASRTGMSYGVTYSEFADCLLSPDRDAIAPEIEPQDSEKGETVPKTVILQGFGVFRGPNLAGWLDADESKGYLLITRKISEAQIPIPLASDNKLLTYYLVGSKGKIELNVVEGKPSFTIKIKTLGLILENGGFDLTPEQIGPLEQLIAEKIREFPLKTIAKAKEYDSDFLGLMEKLHRYNPAVWKEIAPNWREVFREADVDVEVEAKVLNGGMGAHTWKTKQ